MQKTLNRSFLSFFLLIIISCSETSDKDLIEDQPKDIKIKLENILPNNTVLESVQETEMEGYYEVNIEGLEPLYVTSNGKYLVSGDIYEISSEGLINRSDARKRFQRKNVLSKIDPQEFITFKPEIVKHSVYVFTDVDCGYCRQFHRQIKQYTDLGIKINYLAFPREGLSSRSYEKITSAWCSKDPNQAITDLKLGNEIPQNICAENPVSKHFMLGNSLGVAGTPSIITEEGRIIPGYLPPQELIKQLEI